jgi:hypothetical protein
VKEETTAIPQTNKQVNRIRNKRVAIFSTPALSQGYGQTVKIA